MKCNTNKAQQKISQLTMTYPHTTLQNTLHQLSSQSRYKWFVGIVVSLVWKLLVTIKVTLLVMSHYKKIYHLRMWSGNSRGYWLVYCQIQYLATVVQLHLPQKCPWSADSHSCMYVCGRQWSTGKHIGPEKRVQ